MVTALRNTLRNIVRPLRWFYLCKIVGINLHPSSIVSLGAFIDRTRPTLIYIGRETIITRGAVVLSHDFTRSKTKPTLIGDCCFIGANAVVLPGISIGDHSVIGAGSVVTRNVPPHSLAAGNPARVFRTIQTGAYGRISDTI
ncbi:MAG: acyltransferase [Desulfobacteraceae bacterium]|jgi:acetyltransferase-like isoleucine patch superfamily enzyme